MTSGSDQHDRVSLVSMDDQNIMGGTMNSSIPDVGIRERQTIMETAQEVLRRVAQYTEPVSVVQRVCALPA